MAHFVEKFNLYIMHTTNEELEHNCSIKRQWFIEKEKNNNHAISSFHCIRVRVVTSQN